MKIRSLLALLVSLAALAMGLASLHALAAPWLLDMPPIPLGTGLHPGPTLSAKLVAPFVAAGIAAITLPVAVAATLLWHADVAAHVDSLRQEREVEPVIAAAFQEALDRITTLLLEGSSGSALAAARGIATATAVVLDPARLHALALFVGGLGLDSPRPPARHDASPHPTLRDVRLRARLAIVGCASLGFLAAAGGCLNAVLFAVANPPPGLLFGLPSAPHVVLVMLVSSGSMALLAFAAAGGLYLLLRREEATRAVRRVARRAAEHRRLQLYRVRVEDLTAVNVGTTPTARQLLVAHTLAMLVEASPDACAEVVRTLHSRGLLSVGEALDLAGASLCHVELGAERLPRVDLAGVDLRDARLAGCDLGGARLACADLDGADLRRADLRDADLTGARLRGARLQGADLRGACLDGADLRGANLWRAQTSIEVAS